MTQLLILEVTPLHYWSTIRIVHLERHFFSQRLPKIPFCLDLYKGPFCHTLSKALDLSKTTSQISRSSSNDLNIL